jgi:hypothetical protein
VEAYDGDKKIGTLTYANDGTPPTIEVDEAYRRKGVGTAMLKLAKEQGGVLGDAEGGMRGKASEYRTPDGQAFRSAADESTVELTPLEETAQAPAPVADVPAEAAAPVAAPSGRVTSTKNEVTDIERAERGEEQLTSGATITNDATIAKARAELAAKPERGAEVVAKLRNAGTEGISLDDEAILLAEKVRLQAARDAAADRASDPNATDEQRAVAQAEWSEAESQINSLDEAARAGGAEWGRLGQFRQQLIRDDYTFEALERKERAREGRPLTMQESAALKVEADKFAALQAKLDETQAALAEAQASAGAKQTFDDLLTEMKTALGTERKKSRPALATLKARADAAREKLAALEPAKNTKRQGGSAIDPRAFVYLAEIGAYHVANGAVNFADWASKMVADVGAAFKSLPLPGKRAVFKASKEQACGRGGSCRHRPGEPYAQGCLRPRCSQSRRRHEGRERGHGRCDGRPQGQVPGDYRARRAPSVFGIRQGQVSQQGCRQEKAPRASCARAVAGKHRPAGRGFAAAAERPTARQGDS